MAGNVIAIHLMASCTVYSAAWPSQPSSSMDGVMEGTELTSPPYYQRWTFVHFTVGQDRHGIKLNHRVRRRLVSQAALSSSPVCHDELSLRMP